MLHHFVDPALRDRFADLAASSVAKRAEDSRERGELDRESWQEISQAGVW